MGGCPNIVIALTDLQKGEEKAHACEIAWFRKPSRPTSLLRFSRYGITSCLPVRPQSAAFPAYR